MEGNFNKHLGNKLKIRRLSLGLTQTKVANAINVTFQQIQKYEKGTNGVSSIRLLQLSNYLKVPINYFFEDFSEYLINLEKSKEGHLNVNYNLFENVLGYDIGFWHKEGLFGLKLGELIDQSIIISEVKEIPDKYNYLNFYIGQDGIAYQVEPPEKNKIFTHYFVLVYPISKKIYEIYAYRDSWDKRYDGEKICEKKNTRKPIVN